MIKKLISEINDILNTNTCYECNFSTYKTNEFNDHLKSISHIKKTNSDEKIPEILPSVNMNSDNLISKTHLDNSIQINNSNNFSKETKLDNLIKGIIYKCDRCDKLFNHKNDFRKHINRKNPCKLKISDQTNLQSKFECIKCNEIFLNIDNLNKHVSSFCNENNIDNSKKIPKNINSCIVNPKRKKDIIIQCEKCKNIFSKQSNLNRHLNGRCKGIKIKENINLNVQYKEKKIKENSHDILNLLNQKNHEIKQLKKENEELKNKKFNNIINNITNNNINLIIKTGTKQLN